ncbi:hypothetical protein NQ317_000883 [Molorchus minor]|uniref:Uncharacterized protein n=1 Tax=Molorchus minor TaxID=1323400 RepID=A0ABQ9JTJ8_9CUCU|nr:hypothetical protein NQ317_000883 [Molorchus minor]
MGAFQLKDVRGIDCDYSRNDPSTPDFSRTLPKPKTTVFGVFAHIFRCEESIATIPETIRALPIFPELSRSLKPPCEESIATIPEMIRALPIFPELSRSLKSPCLVSLLIFLGSGNRLRPFPKRSEPSRLFPNFPDFSRTLPKARNTVFGVFPYIFRFEESIATIPETIRALPISPELSRSIKTPCLVSLLIFLGPRNRLQLFLKLIRAFPTFAKRVTAYPLKKKISKREDAWPQATPLAAKLPLGSEAARGAAQPPPPASQS